MIKKFKIKENIEYLKLIVLFILSFLSSIFVISYLPTTIFVLEVFVMLFFLLVGFTLLFLVKNKINLQMSWRLSGFFFILMLFNLIYMRFSATGALFEIKGLDMIFNIFWILIIEIGAFVSFYNSYGYSSYKEPKKKMVPRRKVRIKDHKEEIKIYHRNSNNNVKTKKVVKGKSMKTKGIKKVVRRSIR